MPDTPRPWQLLSEAPGSDYRIFRTRRLQVADPRDGAQADRVVLDAPDWVNVVPLTLSGEVVLIRQFRFGVWANTLEIPGGMFDPGEDAPTAVARELEEETGFRPGKLTALGVSHPNPAIQANRLHTFLAADCVKVHAGRQDSSEDIRVELVPFADVPALVRSGSISHSLVLAALYFERLARGG